MKNIVILNAYGSRNIGDAAICDVALHVIDKATRGKAIIYGMFTDKNEDVRKYHIKSQVYNIKSPYGTAIEHGNTPLPHYGKLFRFIKIVSTSVVVVLLNSLYSVGTSSNDVYEYVRRIRESDMVIGMGGGYIRSKNKYKDYFGLILTLLPVYVSKFYKKPVLFLPMSFGNFASNTHKKIAFHALKGTTVLCRDNVSLRELRRLNKEKQDLRCFFMPDLALSYNINRKPAVTKKISNKYIVLTARKWMNAAKQKHYENELAKFISYVWDKHKLKTYFISMASNPSEDDDGKVAASIDTVISNKHIFQVAKVHTPAEVQKLLSSAKISICTRMHSAILSASVYTPFITIGYEHKTLGLMQSMGLKEWHLEIKNVTCKILQLKFNKLNKVNKYRQFIHKLSDNHKELRSYEPVLTSEIRKSAMYGQ